MGEKLMAIQSQVLEVVAGMDKHSFALAGGTALERYYLKHRFSRDLDFFSNNFDEKEIEIILQSIKNNIACEIQKDKEFLTERNAKVLFYMLKPNGMEVPLRLDFVEEVILEKPRINSFEGLPVYAVEDIYYLKLVAVAGLRDEMDLTGRPFPTGRNAPRDALDIYYLSRKIKPLHLFLNEIPRFQQQMFVRWVRTYSRLDMKLLILELNIYDKKFKVREMIKHIDDEVEEFMRGIL